MTLDNGTDGQTDRQTDGQTECDAICAAPPREEGRIITNIPQLIIVFKLIFFFLFWVVR